MDKRTSAIYEACAAQWISKRRPRALEDGRLAGFARAVRPGAQIADLGCGPGWYAAALQEWGFSMVAVDVAASMLAEVQRRAPGVACVRADLMALPCKRGVLDAAWASAAYPHLPRFDLPSALARLHAALRPGATVALTLADLRQAEPTTAELARGEAERRFADDEFPGRLFSLHTPDRARALLEGAGFEDVAIESLPQKFWLAVQARRARSLPDLVGPHLHLLICGLNPSSYSADVGIPFARPGNRFWAAARMAGLVVRDRDALDALRRGVGMTDLVKRATAGAAELSKAEYASGLRRVEALVRLYEPRATCFIGLEGWRQAVDRGAQPGWLPGGFGGQRAYVMPSTSGRNARVPLDELAAYMRRAASGRG